VRVDRRKIDLDVIKRIGRYSIPVHVFEGVTAEVKTLVVPEGGELPPEEELVALEAAEQAEAEAAAQAHEEAMRATEAAIAEDEAPDEPGSEQAPEADTE
jgi:ribosomal protein L9